MSGYDIIGPLHLAGAVAALIAGGLVAAARKGTRYHRIAGWVYVAAMLTTNLTALAIYRLLGTITPFHIAAVMSLITIAAGLIPVRRQPRPRTWVLRHSTWMAGSYIGLWAAAAAETMVRTKVLPFWWAVAAATAFVMVVGMAIAARHIPRSIAGLHSR